MARLPITDAMRVTARGVLDATLDDGGWPAALALLEAFAEVIDDEAQDSIHPARNRARLRGLFERLEKVTERAHDVIDASLEW